MVTADGVSSSPARRVLESSRAVRVLDLTASLTGGLAASLLAGFGMQVLRPVDVERDAGAARVERMLRRGVSEAAPRNGAGLSTLVEQHAPDVILCGEVPGSERDALRASHPAVILVCVTALGLDRRTDGVADTPLTIAARSGWLGITGEPDGPPTEIGGHVPEFASAWAVVSAVQFALLRRDRSPDAGTCVDFSALEASSFLAWMPTQTAAFGGGVMRRSGAQGPGHPWGVYPCRDGHVILIVLGGEQAWLRFADLVEVPALKEERFRDPRSRRALASEVDALIQPWLMQHTAEEIYALGQAAGFPFGTVTPPERLPREAQLEARGYFRREDDRYLPELPLTVDGARIASEGWGE